MSEFWIARPVTNQQWRECDGNFDEVGSVSDIFSLASLQTT